MKVVTRHKDKGEFLSRYRDKIFVRCPRCNNMAIVQSSNTSRAVGRFSCMSCTYQMEGYFAYYHYKVPQNSWFGPVALFGRKICFFCGNKRLSFAKYYPKIVPNIKLQKEVKCCACGAHSVLECSWVSLREPSNAIDPYFGLPLALQANCKHGVVWVYNLEHLAEYRALIQADLRERGKVSNGAWIGRLPKWIKHAKNRPHVLKALQRIEALYLQAA